MKILITGANGRLGTKLANYLSKNHEIIGVDRSISSPTPNTHIQQVDITKIEEIEKIIITEKPDSIIHLAAILGPACESNEELAYQINVLATENLVKLAIKYQIKKFVFASTSAVYNQKTLEPTSELQNVDPQSIYGKTKLKAEKVIHELVAQNTQLKCVILRMFNIYGNEFTESLIYKLINSVQNSPITIVGPENFIRDYIHIDDIIKAFELAVNTDMDRQVEIINIGSGEATSNEELIKVIEKTFPKIYYELKSCELNVSWANIDKSRRLLNFTPNTEINI